MDIVKRLGSNLTKIRAMSTANSVNLIETSKRLAARSAVDKHVTSEIKILGVGSGSTVVYAFERVAELYKENLLNPNLVCVPTSFQAKQLIIEAGLRSSDLDEVETIDVTIDGADEVDAQLNCIKGGGACHLREKIVAMASKKLILIADFRKDSTTLGTNWTQGVPVEVVPFAYLAIANKLKNIKNTLCSATDNTAKRIFENDKPEVCMRTAVRKAGPVVTDNGNFVMDVKFGKIFEPALLENEIKMIPGVIEVGLFCSMAKESWFGNEDGTVSSRTI